MSFLSNHQVINTDPLLFFLPSSFFFLLFVLIPFFHWNFRSLFRRVSKRNEHETLTQCTEWSPLAVKHNIIEVWLKEKDIFSISVLIPPVCERHRHVSWQTFRTECRHGQVHTSQRCDAKTLQRGRRRGRRPSASLQWTANTPSITQIHFFSYETVEFNQSSSSPPSPPPSSSSSSSSLSSSSIQKLKCKYHRHNRCGDTLQNVHYNTELKDAHCTEQYDAAITSLV